MIEKKDNNGCILILGFFDGIHSGHQKVINSAVEYAKLNGLKTILLTFPKSPAEYFAGGFEYIYPRKYNYELIKKLGVDEIEETEFSTLVNIEAEDYIKNIFQKYSPKAIFTGFNYTFGKNRKGNTKLLKDFQSIFQYEYFCIPEYKIGNITVCSSKIKEFIKNGDLKKANEFLGRKFFIESKVIYGNQIGRTIGFPTANLEYPLNIVKLPFGVYKTETLGKKSMTNWGKKPTVGINNGEIAEVHIINYDDNLYGKILRVEFSEKIREEKKFSNLEELKNQLKKDIKKCSE